ncbi:MAG: adenosylcobinamide-GDP ribazoletransferase, partial [Butyrivibrio sp.]|nr:adenosylcobinamide-GDP ribazoletransferase [Butyrivibrio sp.]
HIGAFSVISLLAPALLWIFSLMELSVHMTAATALLTPAIYVLSRILSGLALVCFPAAKKDGLLFTFASASHKKNVRIILFLYAVIIFIFILAADPVAGGLMLLFAVLFTVFYYHMSIRQLGGITGDTEGWFLCITELFMFLILALYIRF